MSEPWWTSVESDSLAQGDFLRDCRLPIFVDPSPSESPKDVKVEKQNLIVITQSCDLENGKVSFVALCPLHTLREFAEVNTSYLNSSRWENVRKGNQPGLHMLASPDSPDDNSSSLVVDFGHIVSLPICYLKPHANSLGKRGRLKSPFLEHFSQSLARFFMRVGLPSSIETFGTSKRKSPPNPSPP